MRQRAPGILLLVLVLVVAVVPARAQSSSSSNTQLWLRYQYQQRIKERVRAFGMLRYEEMIDTDRLFGAWTRLVTTGGISYDLRKRIRLEGAMGVYYTMKPDAPDLFEGRLWQAITLDWPNSLGAVRRYVLHHRFMLEERFKHAVEWDFDLRLRYRLAFTIAINRYTVEPGALFVPLAVELFAPLGDGQEIFTERTRFTAGLGYVLNKVWSAEARYTLQRARSTAGEDYRTNGHIIDIRLTTSIRILDLLKSP